MTLLRKLRQSSEFYDLPVIMFTAMSGAEDETQAIYAGAQDFVRKPFDPRGLTSRIQSVMHKSNNAPRHKDLKTYLAEKSGDIRENSSTLRRLV